MPEISLSPTTETTRANSTGTNLQGIGGGMAPPSTDGMRPGHGTAVTTLHQNGQQTFSAAQTHTGSAGTTATALGNADQDGKGRVDGVNKDKDKAGDRDGTRGGGPDSRADRPGRLTSADTNRFLASPTNSGQGATGAYQSAMPTQQTAPPMPAMASMAPAAASAIPAMASMPQSMMNPTQQFLNSPAGAELLKAVIANSMAGNGDFGNISEKMGTSLAGRDSKVQSMAEKLVAANIPYAWGGGTLNGPSRGISDGGGAADANGDYRKIGFDCSGLARYMHYQLTGNEIPRTSENQYAAGHRISASQLRPGDLVFPEYSFKSGGPGHVQVYVGNNQVIEAPSSGQMIKISQLPPGHYARFP